MIEPSQNRKLKTFTDVQYAFTRHLRDPKNNPAPADIEDRRMGIYRELVYNNIERIMGNMFPILRKITPDDHWHSIIRDFFKRHQSHNPVFNKIPLEFLQYLEQERDADNDPPFILELAQYEWVEYAVSIDVREIKWGGIDPEGDLLEGVPVISPLAWPLKYLFPVHTISPDIQPKEVPSQPTYLVVYRDRNDKVRFIELNPVSARLLELVQKDQNIPGRILLENIANEMQHPNPEVVIKGGADIMQDMRSKDVLLGTKI